MRRAVIAAATQQVQHFRTDAADRVAGVAEVVVVSVVAVVERDARRRHRLARARVLVGEGKAAPAERIATEQGARTHHRRTCCAQAAVIGLAHRRARRRQVRFCDVSRGAAAGSYRVILRIRANQAHAADVHCLATARVLVGEGRRAVDLQQVVANAVVAAGDACCGAAVVGSIDAAVAHVQRLRRELHLPTHSSKVVT